jgi:uncharacterized protein
MFPPETRVTARVNLDRDNLHGLPEMLHDLVASGIGNNVVLEFTPLDTCGEGCREYERQHSNELLTVRATLDHVAELLPLICDLGLSVALPLHTRYLCSAVCRQSVIVEPDGTLKKCYLDVGSEHGCVGTLDESMTTDNPNLSSWLTYDPFSIPECESCEVFGICFGGCPWKVRKRMPRESRCHGRKDGFYKIRRAVDELVESGKALFESGVVVGHGSRRK